MKPRLLLLVIAALPWAVGLVQPDDGPEPNLPAKLFNYASPDLPDHFKALTNAKGGYENTDNTPRSNPVTDEGATLGRVLFYDKRLSFNDTIACASCHFQEIGFSDPERLSTGVNGKTKRHAMPLVNVRYYEPERMFWDERARTLEVQVLMPIEDPVEMAFDVDELVVKLQGTEFYPPLFEAAFGTPEVTRQRISRSLAQFVRSLVSYRSKFDRALVEGLDVLTEEELMGYKMFKGTPTSGSLSAMRSTGPRLRLATCSNCHESVAQTGNSLRNNGLDPDNTLDPGTGGRFKAPSLRNVAVRTNFMHDGRFTSLREVIDHYDTGIAPNPLLSPMLRSRLGGTPAQLRMTEEEKSALIAFLNTLTDEAFLTDPKFSNPFPQQ